MPPDGCAADSPVFNVIAPDCSEPDVAMATLPPYEVAPPLPAVRLRLPPVDATELPADIVASAPALDTEEPDSIAILPPLLAAPTIISIEVLPSAFVTIPVFIDSDPPCFSELDCPTTI